MESDPDRPVDGGRDAVTDVIDPPAPRIHPLPEPTVHWSPCPMDTPLCPPENLHCIPADTPLDAECAVVNLPARYGDPGSGTLEVFVKRKRKLQSNGQLWLLMGGPGSGIRFESGLAGYDQREDLDLYLLEHRGLGRSTQLTCPQLDGNSAFALNAETAPQCVEYLEREHGSLAHFTTTHAAYDLATLIRAMRAPSDEVFIYGVSYGTHWAHRYLQIAPDQATGVILDSMCGPDQCHFPADLELAYDEIGRDLLRLCAADAQCGARLPDPVGRARELYADIDAGHCSPLELDRRTLRRAFTGFLQQLGLREYLPAIIHRLTRCDEGDVAAMEHLAGRFTDVRSDPVLELHDAYPLRYNIYFNEMWAEPTPAQIDAIEETLFGADLVEAMVPVADTWPRYELEPFVGDVAQTDTPILMMTGALDPQTPTRVSMRLRDGFTGEHQTYVRFPYGAHNLIWGSSTTTSGAPTCGQQLVAQFLNSPGTPLDLECVAHTTPPNFNGTPETTEWLFGTPDTWD